MGNRHGGSRLCVLTPRIVIVIIIIVVVVVTVNANANAYRSTRGAHLPLTMDLVNFVVRRKLNIKIKGMIKRRKKRTV